MCLHRVSATVFHVLLLTACLVFRLGVKATNSKAKAKALTSKAKAKDLASKAKAKAKDLAPHPPIRSRPRKVFTVHYITLIIAALSKSLDDDASMCRK